MKFIGFILSILFCGVQSAPKLRVLGKQMPASLLTLPSNATSIRADIEDSFSCDGRDYGYYADVENDCQLFHVCLPVTYSNGRSQTFRWSFICPEETVFNQEIFTCTRMDESIDCAESPRYYNLNNHFGDDILMTPETSDDEHILADEPTHVPDVQQELEAPPAAPVDQIEAVSQIMQEVSKPSTSIYPLYNRRIMKL